MRDASGGIRWNEGRSLHLGLNRVDESVYRGRLPPLKSAEADARAMRDLADSMGFSSRIFVGGAATIDAVRDGLEAAIERLVDGDLLFVSYSGHMTSLAGAGDDPDGWDEAWCLHDGILLDDLFHDLLAAVPAGADVLVVTDACFAGGMVDASRTSTGGFDDPARAASEPRLAGLVAGVAAAVDLRADPLGAGLRARAPARGRAQLEALVRRGLLPGGRARRSRRRRIAARVIALGAASEGGLAFEGDAHGVFTAALLEVLARAAGDEISYEDLVGRAAHGMRVQQPTLSVLGGAKRRHAEATAFARGSAAPAQRVPGPGSSATP